MDNLGVYLVIVGMVVMYSVFGAALVSSLDHTVAAITLVK